MTHPYLTLLQQEAERSEKDLEKFRSRSLTVMTSSAGFVTLLTGLVSFAASKKQGEAGLLPASVLWCLGVALIAFVVAAIIAFAANLPVTVLRPKKEGLDKFTGKERWDRGAADVVEAERVVARTLLPYVTSLRDASDAAGRSLRWAIAAQLVGLVLASIASFVALDSLTS